MSSLSTSLKNSFQRWLHPYEEYLRVAKPGIQQQLEIEYGGPLTPSPGNSPLKKSHHHTPSSLREESPVKRASAAFNASLKDAKDSDDMENEVAAIEAPRPVSVAGFTAVNASRFTPVNVSSPSFTAVNMSATIKREVESGLSSNRRSMDSPISSSKNTPEYRPSGPSHVSIGTKTKKRRLSEESSGPVSRKEENSDDEDSGERRSKRLKKDGAPTVAGSHMTLLRPSTPRIPGEIGSGNVGDKCEGCGKADDPTSFLICDSCDNAYHKSCLDHPVKVSPESEWHCPRCLVGTGEFGFEDGGVYSLKDFQEKADTFKETYFQDKMAYDPVKNCKRPVTEEQTEREFWRLVENLTETVEVEYGADVHSTTHGSGFPTIEKNPLDPYSSDPWNLNILPLHSESLFRHIKSDISGMTVPWLYVGMCFSTFCWHNEDHYTYSANYQHFGATKTWYGIPGEDAERFEEAMREAVPELFETQPDLLFQLTTLLSPSQLQKAGVNVYALDQRAGEFVVTFPQAYHAGFNHGFNFNEAVNFAPQDWEPFGQAGVDRLLAFRRQPCFSHDELLMTAAMRDTTVRSARWLAPALTRIRDRELENRRGFMDSHKGSGEHRCRLHGVEDDEIADCGTGFAMDDQDLPEEDYQCSYCKGYGYLSRFQCKTSSKVLCLLHAGTYECCEATEQERVCGSNHTLRYRYTDEALRSIVQKVVDRSKIPKLWAGKLEKILEDEPRPPLKILRALLSEGERLPFDLPQLPALKAFVERCNEWVDDATNYIVRKQQNRRKNEKAWRKGNSVKAAELEERDREIRKVENIDKLLADAERISFDCPEFTQLRERAEAIRGFQSDAKIALRHPGLRPTHEFEELVELGRSFNLDMPEVDELDQLVQQTKWNNQSHGLVGQFLSLEDVNELIRQAVELGIPEANSYLVHFRWLKKAGDDWESKAKELMLTDVVKSHHLEALHSEAQTLPVSRETFATIDHILNKHREARRHVDALVERSREQNIRNRPKYKEVRDLVDDLMDSISKPGGAGELEKELRRHEDWMRKGKKLFGKANAPLHILLNHMSYVEEHNRACFNTDDRNRGPAEPSSREPTPENGESAGLLDLSGRPRDVFCICRQPESGMMIECELCHEWSVDLTVYDQESHADNV